MLLPLGLRPVILIQNYQPKRKNMVKNNLYNQNEADEPEELEDDSEFKELGDEDLDETESPKSADEDDLLENEGEDQVPETE